MQEQGPANICSLNSLYSGLLHQQNRGTISWSSSWPNPGCAGADPLERFTRI